MASTATKPSFRPEHAAVLAKKTLAHAIRAAMKHNNESVQSLARRLGTGRTSVRRILDEKNTSITLSTMSRAADAVGLELVLATRQMRPAELKRLATALPVAKADAAGKIEEQIVAGFYGRSSRA